MPTRKYYTGKVVNAIHNIIMVDHPDPVNGIYISDVLPTEIIIDADALLSCDINPDTIEYVNSGTSGHVLKCKTFNNKELIIKYYDGAKVSR
jgi:hypothetical protein